MDDMNNDVYANIEEIVKNSAANVAKQYGGTILDDKGIKSITDSIYKQYMKDNKGSKSQDYAQQQMNKQFGDAASTPAPKGSDSEKVNPNVISGVSDAWY